MKPEDIKEVMRMMGRKGGKVRSRKYNKKQLSQWAKLGGRPRKEPQK